MHEPDDQDLLRQFAEQNSETAFAALVARHVDKVYSAALRHTRNAHAAEEITQAVFVILAKKSGRLGAKVILAGWLYETARLTALTFIRSEIRRARREQEAHMQTALNENESEAWPHIAPLLDDALAGLSAADRHAVVLRYFDGKSLGEVGAALGASEDAAKKRVTRAVEKLRGWFTKRGVTLTATVLTAAISANSVQAAPLGLAATVTATAAKGTLISATLTTLVTTTMKTMTWLKIKFAAGVSVAALLAGGAATVVVSQTVTTVLTQTPLTQKPQVMIKALLVKMPTADVDRLLGAMATPSVSSDPSTMAFRALLQREPGVEIVAAPQVLTAAGVEAKISMTEQVVINGTNANAGTILKVTPWLREGAKAFTLEVRGEFTGREKGAPALTQTATIEPQTVPMDFGTVSILKFPVNSNSVVTGNTSKASLDTLVVFIYALEFEERLQVVI
ncbi:MAG: sigma-70 family RNA polymerase sigma factor, partial [Verrucomicrobia bacterium]